MAYESVKNQIDAYIKANGVNLITGPVLNAVLTTMLDELGEGYAFQGVLDTTDTPSPAADIPQAWLASAGTYLGGSITVDEGELALIIHTSDGWSKETVYRGVQLSHDAIVVALGYTPADDADLAEKQDAIADLASIRSGAAAGATAVQPVALNAKQDTIADLSAIRSGAALGSTSVQPADIENMVEAEPIGSIIPPVNPSEFATKVELSQLAQEVTELDDAVDEIAPQIPYYKKTEQAGFLTSAGTYSNPNSNYHSISSEKLSCSPGDKFVYKGYATGNAVSAVFYNGNTVVDSVAEDATLTPVEITIPSGCDGVVFSSFQTLSNPIVFGLIGGTSILYRLDKAEKEIISIDTYIDEVSEVKSLELGVDGYLVNAYGNKTANANHAITKTIELKASQIAFLEIAQMNGLFVLCETNPEQTFYIPLVKATTTSLATYQYKADTNTYICVVYKKSDAPANITLKYAEDIQKGASSAVSVGEMGSETTFLSPTWEDHYLFSGVTGAKSAHTGKYAITQYFPVFAGDYVRYNAVCNSAIAAIVFSQDKITNVVAIRGGLSSDAMDYIYRVPKNGYIAFSLYYGGNGGSLNNLNFRFIRIDRIIAVSNVAQGLVYPGFDKLENITEEPIVRINGTPGLTSIFRHWGFIGDSLASGCMEHNEGGTVIGTDNYDYSWGQMICRMTGADGYNFSYGGQYAKRWITGKNEDDTDNHPERCWPGAKTNLKEAYIIGLGENDRNLNLYPLGDLSTDVGTYDPVTDTDTNGNSFAGYMAGIIQRLQSVQPKAPIFICTFPRRGEGDKPLWNAVIRGLAGIFNNVFILDLWNYAPDYLDKQFNSMYFNGNHMNAMGYQWTAYLFCSYIDWIVRKNPLLFDNQQFVGTDMSYTK